MKIKNVEPLFKARNKETGDNFHCYGETVKCYDGPGFWVPAPKEALYTAGALLLGAIIGTVLIHRIKKIK